VSSVLSNIVYQTVENMLEACKSFSVTVSHSSIFGILAGNLNLKRFKAALHWFRWQASLEMSQ